MHKMSKQLIVFFLLMNFFYPTAYAEIWGSPTGQYSTDKNDRVDRIEHPAVDTFSTVDFFMCVLNVAAENYPNGVWKAQIDENMCRVISGSSDPTDTDSAVADVWLSSTRADNSSPQIVKGWFQTADGDRYLATVTATTAPTTARPNGEFVFKACKAGAIGTSNDGVCPPAASTEGRSVLSVTVETVGGTEVTRFQMIDEYKDYDTGALLTESLYADSSDHKLQTMTGGTKSYNWQVSPPEQLTYEINFDGDYVAIKEGSSTDQCVPMSGYTEYPRAYNLYSIADGSLKTGGAGFPFKVKTSSTATTDAQGYFNYYGAHVHKRDAQGAQEYLKSGDTITPVVDNTTIGITTTDDVVLQLSGGRFFEKTPFSGTLSSKDQNYQQTSMTRHYPDVGEISIYLDTSAQKVVYAKETCNTDINNSSTATNHSGNTVTIDCDLTSKFTWNGGNLVTDNNFGAHSGIVGGHFDLVDVSEAAYRSNYELQATPLTDTSANTGGHNYSNDLYLACYGNECLFPTQDGSTLSTSGYSAEYFRAQTSADTSNDPNESNNDKYIEPGTHTPVYYKLQASDMNLYRCAAYDSSNNVCTGDSYPVLCDPTSSGCLTQLGSAEIHIGQGNLIKADYDVSSGWGPASTATTYAAAPKKYQWGTGTHTKYGKGAFPKVGSTFKPLEAPLEFVYSHDAVNYRNSGDSPLQTNFTLKYDGVGELHGWDWAPQDDGDYYPEISLKDGTLVDVDGDATNDHAVLATQVKLLPTPDADMTNCDARGLSVTQGATTFPTIDSFNINSEITHTFAEISSMSFLSESACVIDGTVQTEISACN